MNKNVLSLIFCLLLSAVSVTARNSDGIPDMKLTVEVDKNAYVGQPVEYRVLLTSSSPNIQDVRAIHSPAVSPETQVIKGSVANQRPEVKTVKGEKFYTWTVLRSFIMPKSAGKYDISEGDFIAFIPFERLVNDFFWGARRVIDYEEVPLKCEKTSFKVSDLPKNKPEGFSDCVGEFSIKGWFPPGRITTGRNAIVILKIEGFGNLSNLRLPNVAKSFVNGCSLVNIEQNDAVSQRNGSLYSEVTLTCTFTPLSDDGEIDPVSITFFNPETKKFQTVSSEPLKWNSTEKKGGKLPSYDVMEI